MSVAPPYARHRWSTMTPDARRRLLDRATPAIFDPGLWEGVREIFAEVRRDGDRAVSRALERFDGCAVPPDRLRLGADEIDAGAGEVSDRLAGAIRQGIANIRRFNERVLGERAWQAEIAPGLVVGERLTPIDRVALFVPSGKASYPSVLMQLGTPATVAGVERIAVVVPPRPGGSGRVDPAVLFVARELGIGEVYRANGVAGIAAAAIGTASLEAVRLVVGPGSPAVTAAQILAQLEGVGTNVLMGPSESLVIADGRADPALIAADMLNEAEHGPDSASLLVTPSAELIAAIAEPLERGLAALPEPRAGYARSALTRHGGVVEVADLDEAVEVANVYAPEHMIIDVADPDAILPRLVNAGEILVGPWAPISAANFGFGVPAALPTGRFARRSSGVTARTFVKATSIARPSREALAALGECVHALAEHEGFPAHAASYDARDLSP